MGAGNGTTAYGMGDDTPNTMNRILWNSRHPGVVMFAAGDGSVKPVRRQVPPQFSGVPETGPDPSAPAAYWVFLELGGARDGGSRDPSLLIP
jgi:hypothetical protein